MENELVILMDGLVCIHLSQGNVSLPVSDVEGVKASASAGGSFCERNRKEFDFVRVEQILQLLVSRSEVSVKVYCEL